MNDATERIEEARPRRFRTYPAYKHSGVEWLGHIPAHWRTERLKYLATLNDDALAEATDPNFDMVYVDIGSVDAVAGITGTEDTVFEKAPSRARRIVRNGDVIVSTVRTYLRAITAIEALEPNLIVSTGFAVIRPRQLESSFASYALRAPHFVERVVANSVGVSYPAINASSLACFPIAYPKVAEQRAIAAFLDRETAKIDGLVARKERLIELLQEKRAALITRAVTRGLDPNVLLKDSGVAWLGEIPAHWETLALSRVTISRCDGPFGSRLKSEHYSESGTRVVRLQNIGWAEFINSDAAYLDEAYARRLGDHSVKGEEILIAGLGDDGHPVGRACVAPVEIEPAMVKADCFRFRLDRQRVLPRYAAFQLSATASAVAGCQATGATRMRMNLATSARRKIALPPPKEQRTIAAFLDRETAKIDALISKIRQAIDHLKEFRTALISATVTGKIDVREEAS